MDKVQTTKTQIGATLFTVERVFRDDAKENALQAIKRLLLQKARSGGRDVLSEGYPDLHARFEPQRHYAIDTTYSNSRK